MIYTKRSISNKCEIWLWYYQITSKCLWYGHFSSKYLWYDKFTSKWQRYEQFYSKVDNMINFPQNVNDRTPDMGCACISPAPQLFVQKFSWLANSKEAINALHYWPFVLGSHHQLVDYQHKQPVNEAFPHPGYGLSQWETTLQFNVVSHWLSPYLQFYLPRWRLFIYFVWKNCWYRSQSYYSKLFFINNSSFSQ